MDNLTEIQRFYENSTVFITGVTGFIGKLLLEKLLRSVPIKKVFVLIRNKKGKDVHERLKETLESPAFVPLRRSKPEVFQKIVIIEGDLNLPMLGMHESDRKTLTEEVNVIFHMAATIKFDEHIKTATMINIRATKDLITIAKQIKKLKAFVYTGTGFANCIKREIKEEIYPSKVSAESLIADCEKLDDDSLRNMTQTLIEPWPNTYTFTKQVMEDYIKREAMELPICITRPTIVISTMSEPIVGFVDSVLTVSKFVVAQTLGIVRITYYKPTVLDVIPADLVVNACVAAGWQTGKSFKLDQTQIPVFHLSTTQDNPMEQDRIHDMTFYYSKMMPSVKLISFPLYFRTTCKYNYLFFRILFHTLVGKMLDFILRVQGKKEKYGKIMSNVNRFQETYEYFTTTPIFLHVNNTNKMFKNMSFEDRKLFNFDVTTINWTDYFLQYIKGLRVYLLDDPMDTLPLAIKKYKTERFKFTIMLLIAVIVLYILGKLFLFRVVPHVVRTIVFVLCGDIW